jgi:hypothetical protein
LLEWDIEEMTSDLKSFIILRSREDNRLPGGFSRVNPLDTRELSWADQGEGGQGFQEGATYRYVVYSSDHAENYSDTVAISIEIPLFTPPDPPSGLLAVNDRGIRVNLNWSASPSVTAQEYIIYRGNGDDLHELCKGAACSAFTAMRPQCREIPMYMLSVRPTGRAMKACFQCRYNPVPRYQRLPAFCQELAGIERNGGIYMRWERVPGDDLAGYRIYRSDIPTGVFEPVNGVVVTETEFFDTGGNASMWYRVTAVDNTGNESRPGIPYGRLSAGGN